MKRLFKSALAALALLIVAMPAHAQNVVQLPYYADNNAGAVLDLGNGPLQIKILQGSIGVWTMSATNTGTATAASTALTLGTSAASNPPCIGCGISGTGIAAGTTVTAFNGTTGVTLSQNTTAALTATPVAYGLACPATPGSFRQAQFQTGQPTGDPPFYTLARICATGQYSPGATFMTFPIGAH